MNLRKLLLSKTVLFAAIGAAGWLLKQPSVDLWTVCQAVGALGAAMAGRAAIEKNGPAPRQDGL